jgi:2-polyprenyl-3-methyl-5-hydroxy-6-metoxy-1,4-benzoquinol methylase
MTLSAADTTPFRTVTGATTHLPEYAEWIDGLRSRLRQRATVLDLGCGCGVPVASSLASHGYAVTRVDFSEVQIDRARRLVPTPTFLNACATRIAFAAASTS